MTNRIFPLHKRNSLHYRANYRGIHLTSQISKAAERFIGNVFVPFLETSIAYGPNQFAYLKGRGARDPLACYTLSWLSAFNRGMKVVMYCSDVKGAFDRVAAARLEVKLHACGLHPQICKLLRSWLGVRKANVIVDGQQSSDMILQDQVFQGTVWGRALRNTFYQDARLPVNMCGFNEIVFADDLNCSQSYPLRTSSALIDEDSRECPTSLHI